MKVFTHNLDKSSKKFNCPRCTKKTLVRFKDNEGNYSDLIYGRCDREVNCGYFLKPEEDMANKPIFIPGPKPIEPPTSFIPSSCVVNTLKDYDQNNFTQWLITLFGEEKVNELISAYRFGVDDSGPYTKDWTVFWQHDINNKARSAKIIKYNSTGHRDKDQSATWYHKKGNINGEFFPEFNLKQCLFGEHLILTNPTKPIALVESEKTAIIASYFLPKYIWLACGGKVELRAEKVWVLQNRSVTLFPDLGAFDDWEIKAEDFGFNISDQIERIATAEDRLKGLDIADFLLKS